MADRRVEAFNKALKFVGDYYESPGFQQRYNNHFSKISKPLSIMKDYAKPRKKIDYLYINPKKIVPIARKSPTNWFGNNKRKAKVAPRPKYDVRKSKILYVVNDEFDDIDEMNAYYDPESHRIQLGPLGTDKYVGMSWDDIIAHELGHALDNSIELTGNQKLVYPITRYPTASETYNVFRNNKLYRDYVKYYRNSGYTDSDMYKRLILRPNDLGDYEHDAKPEEGYGDLMQFRYQLHKNNIYDSTKKNNPFKRQHLNKFKSIRGKNRLFDYFTDEDIIRMMNEVAANRRQKYTSYYG